MTKIFKNSFIRIENKNKDFSLKILKKHVKSYSIIQFLLKFNIIFLDTNLSKSDISDDYFFYKFNKDITNIETYSSLLKKRINLFKYNDTLELFISIIKQFEFYKNDLQKSFLYINPSELLVLHFNDNKKFFINLTENLYDISNDNILISNPKHINNKIIKKYFNPEIKSIKSLPATINYNSWIFSFGILLIYSLAHNLSSSNLMENISDINGTKLYFAIQRCLNIDPNKRVLLFV